MRWTTIPVAVSAMAGLALGTTACAVPEGAQIHDIADYEWAQYDFDYLIPSGTSERIAAGVTVEIMPAVLSAHVGDTLRIRNEDAVAHTIGVFFVGPGETLAQRFTSPGVLSGDCTLRADGVSITVLA